MILPHSRCSAGFIIHIYEGTAAAPGTFQAMTDGTVTKEWAWTHHPAWYAEVTGRNPREDYEQERQRLAARESAMEEWEHAQDEGQSSSPQDPRRSNS